LSCATNAGENVASCILEVLAEEAVGVGAGDTIRWVAADAARPTIARLIEERYFSAIDRIESFP
jgi:hypothetical protein